MNTRWVGSSVDTPTTDSSGLPPISRQRHYGAVELGGTGEQVNVNDVVEIVDTVKIDIGSGGSASQPRLAQVCCGISTAAVFFSIQHMVCGRGVGALWSWRHKRMCLLSLFYWSAELATQESS